MQKKQYHQGKAAKRQKFASKPVNDGTNEVVLLADVASLLSQQRALDQIDHLGKGTGDGTPMETMSHSLPERFSEVEVKISELSSTGDGLGFSSGSDHVYVVPFAVPGDLVQAKVVNHFPQAHYTLTDFIKVTTPATQRDDSLAKCPYFSKCAGCQIQMLPYDLQLQHKKTIVEKAYRNFSGLTPDVVPAVGETIGSPLQYGYRTKLTPHFDGPPGSMTRKAKRSGPSERKRFEEIPPIGFQLKGTRKTIDIEDCPIGTDAVRDGMRTERKRISEEISKYTKGATILLRENTLRRPTPQPEKLQSRSYVEPSPYLEEKTCITDQRAVSTEYIDDYEFKNTAGAFFQNNNSILPKFTNYIRSHIITGLSKGNQKPIKYLIDAYCGSGLFTVTLSSLFSSSMGIDIAEASIVSARENADANKVSNASFISADASKLFEQVTYQPEKTVVIIDPPRKGCDGPFLQQLLKFGPSRVVYVSCNVHTQARDVGVLVEGAGGCRYEIESLQGFDFFPQTGHVEGVAILARTTPQDPV
ncbi:tRNA(m5U54)methyltransferase [Usnea florida]